MKTLFNLIFIVIVLIYLSSCEKSDEGPITINTKFNHHILSGYDIVSIAFDNLGNMISPWLMSEINQFRGKVI